MPQLITTDLLSKRQCGKVYYSYRSVSIGQDAVEILREQQGKTGSEYVFPSSAGGPISPDSVLKMLHRVLKRAGLPEIRFHDLRHPYVKPMTKKFSAKAEIPNYQRK